jgi:type I restriction enzyme S subunit
VKHEYDLTPIRYITIKLPNRNNENFSENIKGISSKLSMRAKEFCILEAEARRRLNEAGYKEFKDISFGYASNVNLSEFIKNVFTQWFIRFEFPDNKNEPYRSNKGEFVYSEELEQKIPKGWEVVPITKVAKLIDCLHTKKPEPTDTGKSDNILLQVYNIGEFGLLDLSNIFTVSNEDYKEWTKNILLQEGDCIITNAGLTGALAQIPHSFSCGIGRNLTSIRPNEIAPSYLIEYLLSDYGTQLIKKHLDVGTIFDSLNVKGIKKFMILMPPRDSDIMQKFENIARPLRKIMEKNAYENLILSPKKLKYEELDEVPE